MTKRRNWRIYIIGFFITLFALTAFMPVTSYAAAGYIRVFIDGKNLEFDVPPIIQNDRTLAPFRKIGEALGAEVKWDQDTKTVTAYKQGTTLLLRIGMTLHM